MTSNFWGAVHFAGEPFFDALQEKYDVQAAGVFYYLCAPITTTGKDANTFGIYTR